MALPDLLSWGSLHPFNNQGAHCSCLMAVSLYPSNVADLSPASHSPILPSHGSQKARPTHTSTFRTSLCSPLSPSCYLVKPVLPHQLFSSCQAVIAEHICNSLVVHLLTGRRHRQDHQPKQSKRDIIHCKISCSAIKNRDLVLKSSN